MPNKYIYLFTSLLVNVMEAQLSFLVIPFFVIILLHWFVKYCKPNTNLANKLPPGPRKLPFIGNLHQLALVGKLPHHALRDFANKYGPIMHLQLGEISTIVVSSPNLAKEVLKTHDIAFANRPKLLSPQILAYGATDIAFSPYGDYWRQMKKICVLELLSAKRVKSFSYIREDETEKFIKLMKSLSGTTVGLTTRIYAMVSSIISRAAFGDKSESQDEFVSLVRNAIALTGGFELADLFPSVKAIPVLTGMKSKFVNIHKRADKILENIVRKHAERRARRKEEEGMDNNTEAELEDLVDVLLRVQQSGKFDMEITIQNIKAVVWDVFAAGTDTTATTIEWAMSEMMKNPTVREKAQAELREKFKGKEIISETDVEELSYLKLVIKETLRLHPASPLLIPRESYELTNIEGYDIPKNTQVIVNAWAMGRDPEFWSDAESFIPERFDDGSIDYKGTNFEYIPFGSGRRMCPGMSFGLAAVALPLARLLYHFNWEIPNNMKHEDLNMIERFGMAVGRKWELCLIPTVYHP